MCVAQKKKKFGASAKACVVFCKNVMMRWAAIAMGKGHWGHLSYSIFTLSWLKQTQVVRGTGDIDHSDRPYLSL